MSAFREPKGEPLVPSRLQVDAVTRFLSSFERQGFWFERVVSEGGQITSVEKSPEAKMFLRVLRDNGFLLEGERRGSWQKDPEAYFRTSARINRASLPTLQRLFTDWVERDKALPGHLGALFKRGDLTAALRRLAELRETAPDVPTPIESSAENWLDWE